MPMNKVMLAMNDISEEYIEEVIMMEKKRKEDRRYRTGMILGFCAMLCLCVISVIAYYASIIPDSPAHFFRIGETVTNEYGTITFVEYTGTTAVFDVINTSDQPYILGVHLEGRNGRSYDHNSKEITIYFDGEAIDVSRLYPDGKVHRVVIDFTYLAENDLVLQKYIGVGPFGIFGFLPMSDE